MDGWGIVIATLLGGIVGGLFGLFWVVSLVWVILGCLGCFACFFCICISNRRAALFPVFRLSV